MDKFDGGKVTKWKQGDYEFAIRCFDPFTAIEVLGDLQKILIPSLGGAVDGIDKNDNSVEMVAAIGGALKSLSKSVSGKILRQSAELLLDSEYVAVKGKEDKSFSSADSDRLSAIYWGRPFDMVALCVKVFQVNFLDFSTSCSVPTGVRDLVSGIQQMVQEQSGSTSEGVSSSTE